MKGKNANVLVEGLERRERVKDLVPAIVKWS
jgi:hypothetical protein